MHQNHFSFVQQHIEAGQIVIIVLDAYFPEQWMSVKISAWICSLEFFEVPIMFFWSKMDGFYYTGNFTFVIFILVSIHFRVSINAFLCPISPGYRIQMPPIQAVVNKKKLAKITCHVWTPKNRLNFQFWANHIFWYHFCLDLKQNGSV